MIIIKFLINGDHLLLFIILYYNYLSACTKYIHNNYYLFVIFRHLYIFYIEIIFIILIKKMFFFFRLDLDFTA